MYDDFKDIIVENIKVERNNPPFKITQLKLTNCYLNSGDIDVGMPVSTSIELKCKYDLETDKLHWYKTVTHAYVSLTNYHDTITDSFTEEFKNPDDIILKIEETDLRKLKNNYFTEENPECFTHWEITYNTYFKIVGTYDQVLDAFEKISKMLNFEDIMKTELKKIEEKISQNN